MAQGVDAAPLGDDDGELVMTDDHDPGDYDRNETAQTGASPQKARPIKRLAVTSLSQWRPR